MRVGAQGIEALINGVSLVQKQGQKGPLRFPPEDVKTSAIKARNDIPDYYPRNKCFLMKCLCLGWHFDWIGVSDTWFKVTQAFRVILVSDRS